MKIVVTPKYFIEEPWRLENLGLTHIISIQESADYGKYQYPTPPSVLPYNHYRFYFDDVTNEYNHMLTAPVMEDIVKIAERARQLPEWANVLIHCHAGVSRSPAVALGVLACKYAREVAWEEWLKIPSSLNFWPNELIVQLFDEYLQTPDQFFYKKIRQWKQDYKDRLAADDIKLILPFDE